MVYQKETKSSIEDIRTSIENKAKKVGFGVLGSYEFKKILKSKGYEIEKDITVFELCNPPAAQKALGLYPEVSVYLPCRLSVYQEGDVVILATIHIDDIVTSLDTKGSLKLYLEEIFEKMKQLINDL